MVGVCPLIYSLNKYWLNARCVINYVPDTLLDAENILMMKINMVSDIIDIHRRKEEKDK